MIRHDDAIHADVHRRVDILSRVDVLENNRSVSVRPGGALGRYHASMPCGRQPSRKVSSLTARTVKPAAAFVRRR
jgi:hypothetical protein